MKEPLYLCEQCGRGTPSRIHVLDRDELELAACHLLETLGSADSWTTGLLLPEDGGDVIAQELADVLVREAIDVGCPVTIATDPQRIEIGKNALVIAAAAPDAFAGQQFDELWVHIDCLWRRRALVDTLIPCMRPLLSEDED